MERTKLTHEIQVMLGHPTDRRYKAVVSNKLLTNFHITSYEITNKNYMFGIDLSDVRGNKLRYKPSRLDREEYVKISEYFYKFHKFVALTDDIIFVNGNAFMIKLARKRKFVTVDNIPRKKSEKIRKV